MEISFSIIGSASYSVLHDLRYWYRKIGSQMQVILISKGTDAIN